MPEIPAMYYLTALLVGWCGTPPPRPWPWPSPLPDPPEPWNPWVVKAIGTIGGLVGGVAFNAVIETGFMPTVVGAFVGATLAVEAKRLMGGARADG